MVFILIILLLIVIFKSVKVVPQTEIRIVERLGKFKEVWESGIHFKIPFIDRLSPAISEKEQVMDFPPQPVITKDNVTVEIDSVTYVKVIDAKKYYYGVDDARRALENLTATTLRSVIGEMELDETLSERDRINAKMQTVLDEATDKWGIKVNRVEVKNIMPPEDIQNAMERQMRAERERRAKILDAEGNKKAAILTAEGQKEAKILSAQAEKEAAIQRSEGIRQSEILEAQGKAEAIRELQKAEAESLTCLSKAEINQSVLRLQELKAMEALANGQATKLIVPSDLQKMSANVASIVESAKE